MAGARRRRQSGGMQAYGRLAKLAALLRTGCGALLDSPCVLCGAPCAGAHFCAGCRGILPWIRVACPRCGQPLARPLPDGLVCADCLLRPPPFSSARAPLHYRFPVDSALKALKFNGRLYYAPAFAALMVPELEHLPGVDALLPVPLHRRRHAARGFNQALELARPLARASGLPVLTLTRRLRHTRPQAGLSAAERRRNLGGAFAVTRPLPCRHPLIVDDVVTTGETCAQLARALKAAGCDEVSVLAAARAGEAL